jgi:nicotinate-nucleotide pyrophosphorylase (carboxylating)
MSHFLPDSNREQLEKLIHLALIEDVGSGDITTNAIYSGTEKSTGIFIAKQDGVVAGIEVASIIATMIDPEIHFHPLINDGDRVSKGDHIAKIDGRSDMILTAERIILNFMQRMSGIATQVRTFMDEISHTKAVLLDTRKTVPGHRVTDKMAVLIGGGQNHRYGLYDRYLIKENHIRVAGGIPQAINACVKHRNESGNSEIEIEIEVTNLDEFEQALQFEAVNYVMLDNMSAVMMKKAVDLNSGQKLLEASGNVNLETVKKIAETGVDFISVGSITHSVIAMDISLLFES